MAPQLKVVKNENEYKKALKWFEELFDAPAGSEDEQTMEVLSILIEKYEEEQYPIDMPDPIGAIKFRMEQEGLTQKDLVPYIGSRSKVSEILAGKRELSLSMIRALNEHLGIPAEVLLKEQKARLPSEYSEWEFERFPITEMERNGAFKQFNTNRLKDRAEEAIRFLVKRAGGFEDLPVFAYRKTDGMRLNAKLDYYSLLGWSLQVLAEAREKKLQVKFDPAGLSGPFLENLVGLSIFPEGPVLAVEYLANHGIWLHIVPHLSKTYLDGAAFMLESGTPVIGMTLRFDRLDNFWFVLLHELGHLYLGHFTKDQRFFADDFELRGKMDELKQEKEADDFAEKVLLPDDFDLDKQERVSTTEVITYSRKINRHPAIAAGRIQYTRNNFRIFSRLLGRGEVRKLFFQGG
jgi:HTH-type transcriptional regulator/antitoxin HigA